MIKRLLIFTLLTAAVAIAAFAGQQLYLDAKNHILPYSLENIYIFHAVAYILIVVSVEALNEKLPNQVGFFYLGSMFVKIGLFLLIFGNKIFGTGKLVFLDRLQIIIPFFLFLLVEAIYSGRLMNAK